MKLLSIKFNSFKTVRSDTLDIEKDITCLVGINEAGKSNVLFGIEKCDREKELTNEDISRQSDDYLKEDIIPTLEAVFTPSNFEEKEQLKSAFGCEDVEEIRVVKEGKNYRIDYPAIVYKESSFYNKGSESPAETEGNEQNTPEEKTEDTEERSIDELKQQTRTEVESLVVSLLPNFYYFDSVDFEQYFLPPEGDVSISELVSNPDNHEPVINLLKLAEISPQDLAKHSSPQEKVRRDTRLELGTEKANQKLLRAFWPIDTVQIHLTAEGDILKIRIREDKEFLPGERSRGLQWALAFNIFFLASTDEKLKDSVLLIDEPGIFLHIEGQRKMISSTFPEITRRGNQIIYTTHLPYLIDKDFPERIRILEKEKEDTKIGNKAWSSSEFGSIPEPVRTALGINIDEAFLFGEQNLVVEGPADHIYIRLIFQKFDDGLLNKLTVVPAYGVDKVPKVMTLAMMSNNSVHGVIDADKDIEIIREQFRKVGIKDPPVENISIGSTKTSIKTIEDILPASLFQEAVYRVYRKECGKRKRGLDKKDIPKELPRQVVTEKYFKKKLTSSRHKLLKMEIARSFKELIEENYPVRVTEWSVAKSLVKGIKQFMNGKKSKTSDEK